MVRISKESTAHLQRPVPSKSLFVLVNVIVPAEPRKQASFTFVIGGSRFWHSHGFNLSSARHCLTELRSKPITCHRGDAQHVGVTLLTRCPDVFWVTSLQRRRQCLLQGIGIAGTTELGEIFIRCRIRRCDHNVSLWHWLCSLFMMKPAMIP